MIINGLVSGLWQHAATALSLMALIAFLHDLPHVKRGMAFLVASQLLSIEAGVMGGHPLMDIGTQLGWLVPIALMWNKARG